MGARMYDRCGAVMQWRVAQDTDVAVQAKSTTWDVAVTLLGLLWVRDSADLTISRQARLVAAILCAVGEWTSLPPAARWAQLLHHRGL